MTAVRVGRLDHLGPRDFQRLAQFIHTYSGIKMPPGKQTLVEGRLRRRVRALGMANLSEYCRYLFDHDGLDDEAVHLIDVVTTNKTEFFREPEHFRFLTDTALPRLMAERQAGINRPVKIWSAACSTGAEPYTLAMVLADFNLAMRGFNFSILATDICTEVLARAATGIYPEEMVEPVPLDIRRRYLMRAKDRLCGKVRIVPEVRRLVRFGRVNLMDESYPVDQDMDVIFCRNVLIYFDKATQQSVLSRLCHHLRPGGYLIVGHSETVTGFDLPLNSVATTAFRRV